LKETAQRVAGHAAAAVRLLVVSRDPSWMGAFFGIAEGNQWQMEGAGSGSEALERVQSGHSPTLVVVDVAPGDSDGLYTLRWLHRVRPSLPVVLLASEDDSQRRAEATRLGASDYLLKPVEARQLEAAVRRHLSTANSDGADSDIVGEQVIQVRDDRFFMAASALMRKLRAQAELLAQVDVPLLIVGETGSGKETTARLIHKFSVRSGFPFIKVNCAALPADLLEKELFGHGPGPVTGGSRGRPGKFELAEKGTVLLDDVVDLSAGLQARLVHLLQEKRHFRQNGGSSFEADVRIIAATGADLEQALSQKRLREDLYYQLSAFTVHVPPLRQRKEEIPLLLGHMMNQLAKRYALPTRNLSPEIFEACRSHAWPGNLRELESFVKRYLVIGDEQLVLSEIRRNGHAFSDHDDLLSPWDKDPSEEGARLEDSASGLRSLVQTVKGETERNAIAVALEQTHWNRKAAARLLKVSYRTLLYKIQQYHMTPPAAYLSPSFTGPGLKDDGHGS
jgi:two-component system, NtrC family, response regulator AtoC